MTQILEKPNGQRLIHDGHTWEQFKLIQKGFDGSPGVRLAYYNGTVEILMPGRDHEMFASFIGYLVMTFLLTKGIRFKPTRSMTQEKEGVASVQADESYSIGEASVREAREIADLSIEVVFSSGGESKLARYQALECLRSGSGKMAYSVCIIYGNRGMNGSIAVNCLGWNRWILIC